MANLLPRKNALDNAVLLREVADKTLSRAEVRDRARAMLKLVGLEDAAKPAAQPAVRAECASASPSPGADLAGARHPADGRALRRAGRDHAGEEMRPVAARDLGAHRQDHRAGHPFQSTRRVCCRAMSMFMGVGPGRIIDGIWIP